MKPTCAILWSALCLPKKDCSFYLGTCVGCYWSQNSNPVNNVSPLHNSSAKMLVKDKSMCSSRLEVMSDLSVIDPELCPGLHRSITAFKMQSWQNIWSPHWQSEDNKSVNMSCTGAETRVHRPSTSASGASLRIDGFANQRDAASSVV